MLRAFLCYFQVMGNTVNGIYYIILLYGSQRGMETRRYRRRTSRARHVPDDIPRGGHVEDAMHDKHEHRAEARAERQEQNYTGSAEGGNRAHIALQRPDRAQPAQPAVGSGEQDTENDVDDRQTRADHRARRLGVGQDVDLDHRLPGVREMVRQEADENCEVLGRDAQGLVQPGAVADHLRATVLHTSAERSVRAPGCVVRPAVRQRLVPDVAETVRGRV